MGHILEDRCLRAALLAAIDASPLRRAPRRGAGRSARPSGPAASRSRLAAGGALRGRLLVGCDGRDSQVAARAGIRRRGWDYRQTSLVCAVAHERPHHGIAHQFFMPAGPLAILPLPGDRSSIVWTEARDRAAAIAALDEAGYLAELRPRFGDFLGAIRLDRRALQLSAGAVARRALRRPSGWRSPATPPTGMHPIAGQGLNLGLRDVAALAEVLVAAHRRGLDLGAADVLADYARWRRFDTALLVAATDGLNRLFSNDNPLLRLGRDLGLGLVNRLPALRRGLIREAAGLSGDLPRLLRGRPL